MSNLPDPRDYQSPRTWRRAMLAMLLTGVFIGAALGAMMYDLLVATS